MIEKIKKIRNHKQQTDMLRKIFDLEHELILAKSRRAKSDQDVADIKSHMIAEIDLEVKRAMQLAAEDLEFYKQLAESQKKAINNLLKRLGKADAEELWVTE